MSTSPPGIDRRLPGDTSDEAFRAWLRKLVTGAAALQAFDDGEIDAVMDRASGSAVLLPEAQSALHSSNRIVLRALEALPGEVCVLDPTGTVLLTNKGWRGSAARHGAFALDVRDGGNFFVACSQVREQERAQADGVTAALRQVLTGVRESLRCSYAWHARRARRGFTLSVAAMDAGDGTINAVVTREWTSTRGPSRAPRARGDRKSSRLALVARTGAANGLLARLPAREYAELATGLELVELKYGEVLYEPGERIRTVYFPCDSLVSLLTLVEGHRALEVGLVGREGMIGARLALGADCSSVRALVQGTGTAMRMKAARFLKEFNASPTLQRLLFQFTDNLMIQVSQTAACNRFHMVEARLARWLLMTADRMAAERFHLTHEFLADMLGVRRVGVTTAASALQRRKLIGYRRGDITILDRPGLEQACCSCYRYVQSMAGDSAR